jgi:hypothetical protein
MVRRAFPSLLFFPAAVTVVARPVRFGMPTMRAGGGAVVVRSH